MESLHHISTVFVLVMALLVSGVPADDEARNGRCPPLVKWGVCPPGALACSAAQDCGPDLQCCESPCGGVCTKPLFTGCEHLQMAATRRARALGSEGRSVRVPRCTREGDFDPIQCDNEIVGSCWCMDDAGFELPGTKAPARGLVNCTAPAACAAATCRMLCPHGFTLAEDGCPQCRCRDPCAGVKCPGQLACQLEEVACLRQPCPPVPTCKRGRSLDNVCPVGDPLMISDTQRPFLCGTDPGKPTCPPLYQCFVQRGNDYGVCCPASLKIQKPGMCPAATNSTAAPAGDCDSPCAHDLECPSMQKCCQTDECGKHCVFPDNLTECLQQKALAEALSLNEREGRGYIPQCSAENGAFQQRQCSRNGLVCWCVDPKGLKAKGSMGPANDVDCSKVQAEKGRPEARSLSKPLCDRNICASICEYGFRVDTDGCPSCECDDPCQGFPCAAAQECIPVKEASCQEEFCPTYPVCRPKVTYVNPCMHDAPLTNDTTGEIIDCDPENDEDSQSDCPVSHRCIQVANSAQAVCCPVEDMMEEEDEGEDYSMKPGLCPFSVSQLCGLNDTRSCVADDECDGDAKCCLTSSCGSVCAEAELKESNPEVLDFNRSPSMCEYLRDFNDKMEGTDDGMKLALPKPECHTNGSFTFTQCLAGACWCVDSFGTEIPATRANGTEAAVDCVLLRETSECLELTCRLGCDYGFVFSAATQCPLCQCRNPCQEVTCAAGQGCQMVDVACDNDYCPPVPACLPQKAGECPYLVPSEGAGAGSCDYACQSDAQCSGEHRCCSNGCGTHCVQPIMKTACQHQRAIVLHKASDEGIPGRQLYVPACRQADGGFELVQCHELKGTCWCVDEAGQEISGTRTSGDKKPQCQAPSTCPAMECFKECEHGYALDIQGCSTCRCRDPCEDMKCPNEGEVCKVVKVECVSDPCPPVALCVGSGSEGVPSCGGADGAPARRCGPSEPPCPSSHKCHLPPLTAAGDNPPVCCPKPRSVCFDPKDEGMCVRPSEELRNSTVRWHFSPEKNQCLQFKYDGCSGNHNNFQTEQHCNTVCPVLSQCERLREKNQKAAIRYKKDTFMPRCRPDTGEWQAVQCMEHIGVCWCANGRGEPLKGSLVRGQEPACNFRQARRRMDLANNDDVLEELVRHMTDYNFIDSIEETDIEPVSKPQVQAKLALLKRRCLSTQERLAGSSAAYEVTCDSSGRFNPTQCESSRGDAKCWCVDEAGNQLSGTSTFSKGDSICLPTPIEAVHITLGFFGDFSSEISGMMKSQLLRDLTKLGATIQDKQIELLKEPGVTYIHFTVVGNNKVDIAYHLEELVKQEELSLSKELVQGGVTMVADIRKSTFHHKLGTMKAKSMADNKIIALQHREILSESTVSVLTSYHTAIIVLAAASAFIISTMSVLLMLYRKKVSSLGSRSKVATFSDRFLPSEPPVYVLSRQEKQDLAEAMNTNESTESMKM